MIGAVPFARRDLNWRFTNVDLVAQRLLSEAGPDDFIIVSPWYCGITFDRYYKGPASWNTLPPLKDHSTHRFDLVREQMQKKDVIQAVFRQIAATLQSGHRVWVVGTMDIPKSGALMPADLPPVPSELFGNRFALYPELDLPGRPVFERPQRPVLSGVLHNESKRELRREYEIARGRGLAKFHQQWDFDQCQHKYAVTSWEFFRAGIRLPHRRGDISK